MELLQVASMLGSLVVIFGLLKIHRVVVREHVLPSIKPDEDLEE